MMDIKAKLAIVLKKRFPPRVYRELVEKGFRHIGEEWIVPYERKKEFESIIGAYINIEEIPKTNIRMIDAPTERKGTRLEPIEIIEGEGAYHVRLSGGKSPYTIPSVIVDTYYEVIKELRERGVRRIKKRELVEKALRKLGITRYFSKDGRRFFWEAFYGDRVAYHTHYYVPVKILDVKGVVRVTKQDDIIIP